MFTTYANDRLLLILYTSYIYDFLVAVNVYDCFHVCLVVLWQFLGLDGDWKDNGN